MKYYAYYRVSTESQVEKNGIQMQIDVVTRYAAEHGIEIAASFKDEGISGTREDREGLYELLSTMEYGDKVIVQNTSRLWRDNNVKVFVHKVLKDKKIRGDVLSVENERYSIYKQDPQDNFFNHIMEALDELDRDMIAMKLAKGRKAKAQRGGKSCGIAPYGYRWEGRDIVPDEETSERLQAMFREYVNSNWKCSAVVRLCKNNGWKTARGNEFTIPAVKSILSNEFYVGVVRWNGAKSQGTHKPIVDEALFRGVQEHIGHGKCF